MGMTVRFRRESIFIPTQPKMHLTCTQLEKPWYFLNTISLMKMYPFVVVAQAYVGNIKQIPCVTRNMTHQCQISSKLFLQRKHCLSKASSVRLTICLVSIIPFMSQDVPLPVQVVMSFSCELCIPGCVYGLQNDLLNVRKTNWI